MADVILYYVKFGGSLSLLTFVVIFSIYWLSKTGWLLTKRFVLKDPAAGLNLSYLLKGGFLIYFILIAHFFFSGLVLEQVSARPAPTAIMRASRIFMIADEKLFGIDAPFWLQSSANPIKPLIDRLTPLLIWTYRHLSLALGIIFLILLTKNGKLFYQGATAFILTLWLSVPFWFWYPAISPQSAFLDNIFHNQPPAAIQQSLTAYSPNPALNNYLQQSRNLRNEFVTEGVFDVTTMPSMHVAWTTVAVYYGIQIWPPLAILLIPYFILNAIASILTLNHYAVDALAGLLTGAMAILLAWIIGRRRTPKPLTDLVELIKQDVAGVIKKM